MPTLYNKANLRWNLHSKMHRKARPLSVRKKISTSCKQRIMTPQWKARLRAAILKRCAKKVICVETGKTYESVSAAARAIGVAPIQVSRVCRGLRESVHGLTFRFSK
jgi:hypothetical protein